MKQFLILILISISASLFSQNEQKAEPVEKRNSITVGFLQGGGSLVGADIEFLLSDKVGFQLGAGLVGFGGGINYHFEPSIRSSFLSLQYWNQGAGATFVQNAVGPSFVYRGRKWLTAQLGFGFPLSKGPAFPKNMEQPPVMLLYSIGAYIPF
jgi:hypothetical protein